MLEQIPLYSRFWALVPGYTLFPLHWAWQECEYAEWEWAENRNGNFNSFRRWLISRLPNRPSGGSFNRRQSGSTSSLIVLFHQRAICSKTNKYNNLVILCSVKASKFSFVFLLLRLVFFFFFFCLIVSIHSRASGTPVLSTACLSGRWVLSGSSSWTPWQSGEGRSSPCRPRPPGPWRRSSSLVRSHKKNLNAVAERQRHSGRPDIRISTRQVCIPHVYTPAAYKHVMFHWLLGQWVLPLTSHFGGRALPTERDGTAKEANSEP